MSKDRDDFVKIRRGVFEHLSKGWMTADMLVMYMCLLDGCDWKTGVWKGSAKRLSKLLGWKVRKTQRVFSKLDDARYITSKYVADGNNLEYDVLINNYTPPNSKTTVRMRPTKAGLNRVKNDAPPCVKNDADQRQKRRTPASNLTTKYSDLESTDYISEGEAPKNLKTSTHSSLGQESDQELRARRFAAARAQQRRENGLE
ncbi:MAG: hypothetical protein C5B59_08780 [Bacteroidetes bacterium]|nr:MAG: hypothetical protein C5B59_08780 [Bacteroidota bacterium]